MKRCTCGCGRLLRRKDGAPMRADAKFATSECRMRAFREKRSIEAQLLALSESELRRVLRDVMRQRMGKRGGRLRVRY